MKTVLLATSALVAFAGAAAAEVAVSGDARIGLRYEDSAIGCVVGDAAPLCADGGWNVVNRARVKFTMTGETDSGLSFGAELRADQASGANSSRATGTGMVWLSGDFGKLSAGDVDSALENAVGDLPEVGLTGLDYGNEFFYALSDTNIAGDEADATLLYEYKIGDASLYASFQDRFSGYSTLERGSSWSLGAGYTLGNYSFGFGYESADYTPTALFGGPGATAGGVTIGAGVFSLPNDHDTWAISGGTSISGITFKAIYAATSIDGDADSVFEGDIDADQLGLGAEYKMANGVGVAGYWRSVEVSGVDAAGADLDFTALSGDWIGVGASYDLGGGATVKGGIARFSSDDDTVGSRTLADFGVALKF